MPVYSRITGEIQVLPSPLERQNARLARMRHLVWLGVKTMATIAEQDGARLIMYTLTYKGLSDWEPRHISRFCRWLRDNGHLGYTWVGELQKRGAVHYHVLALLPKAQQWRKPNEDNGGWTRGFTWVTDFIEKPLYIMKYLQKGSKDGKPVFFPAGFRLYALSQSVVRRMQFEHSVSYRLSQVPGWLRTTTGDNLIYRCATRVTGGIDCGRFVAVSPYSRKGLTPIDDTALANYTSP